MSSTETFEVEVALAAAKAAGQLSDIEK